MSVLLTNWGTLKSNVRKRRETVVNDSSFGIDSFANEINRSIMIADTANHRLHYLTFLHICCDIELK